MNNKLIEQSLNEKIKYTLEVFTLFSMETRISIINELSNINNNELSLLELEEKYFDFENLSEMIDYDYAIWKEKEGQFILLEDLINQRKIRLANEVRKSHNNELILTVEEQIKLLSLLTKDDSINSKNYSSILLDKHDEILQGEVKSATFRMYGSVFTKWNEWTNTQRAKNQDLFSLALLEFIENSKKKN